MNALSADAADTDNSTADWRGLGSAAFNTFMLIVSGSNLAGQGARPNAACTVTRGLLNMRKFAVEG